MDRTWRGGVFGRVRRPRGSEGADSPTNRSAVPGPPVFQPREVGFACGRGTLGAFWFLVLGLSLPVGAREIGGALPSLLGWAKECRTFGAGGWGRYGLWPGADLQTKKSVVPGWGACDGPILIRSEEVRFRWAIRCLERILAGFGIREIAWRFMRRSQPAYVWCFLECFYAEGFVGKSCCALRGCGPAMAGENSPAGRRLF